MIEQIRFTTRVLGPVAAYRLEKRQVTQTLRSESSSIVTSILNGRASVGDQLEIAVTWRSLALDDAHRGGFDSLEDLSKALQRAGYRFKPMDDYQLFRIQFSWLEEAYV